MGKVPKVDIRDVSPFLQMFRNVLLGREHVHAIRFPKDVASRSPPLPNIPGGPAHRLNNNYYCTRDGRREVKPAIIVKDPQAQLPPVCPPPKKQTGQRRPGNIHHWD